MFCIAFKRFLLKKKKSEQEGISKGLIVVQSYDRLLLVIQTAQALITIISAETILGNTVITTEFSLWSHAPK